MKKNFLLMMIIAVLASPVFASEEAESISEKTKLKKHQFLDNYFGFSTGAAGMKTGGNGVFTANLGVVYGFYLHEWVSINTGLLFHTEIYSGKNLLTNNEPMVTPLCFAIPFGVHFNIPKIEWLYTGISAAVNIPIADLRNIKVNTEPGGQNDFTKKDIFLSLPVDFGFDFIKPGRGGSRAFFRITPTFHKSGISVPVGFIWQIYNWKVFSKKVEVEIPNVEVNVPPAPSIIIIH